MKLKNEVYVVVDTPKKAKKLKKVLDMFGEDIYSEPNHKNTGHNGMDDSWRYGFSNGSWQSFNTKWVGHNVKTFKEVSIKELRDILAKEHYTNKELEVGKWYRMTGGSIVNYQGGNKGYGVHGGCLTWYNNDYWSFTTVEREATSEEVEQALIEEAKGRGFKARCLVRPIVVGYDEKYKLNDSVPNYYSYLNCLYLGGALVFKGGKWAEVIKPETEMKTINVNEILFKIGDLEDQIQELKKLIS